MYELNNSMFSRMPFIAGLDTGRDASTRPAARLKPGLGTGEHADGLVV